MPVNEQLLQRLINVYGNDAQSIRQALSGIKGGVYRNGGKIHIKPENRGKFTALKKRTGHSASWFKAHGTTAQKKMAVFELNAAKWGHRHDVGGPLLEDYDGGYTIPMERRVNVYNSWDPSSGFTPMDYVMNRIFGNGNSGEEGEYWKAYLGIPNNVPRMLPSSKTEFDDSQEAGKAAAGIQQSEFYGTTPRMDQMIQVIADTLNLGNIVRNYDEYKERYPQLSGKKTLLQMYNQGKSIMDNPGVWMPAGETGPMIKSRAYQADISNQPDYVTGDNAPLGMLGEFRMKWSPKDSKLYVYDTYDFPRAARMLSGIPDRPKEMKIRGAVNFNPLQGSVLLRNGDVHFDKKAASIVTP